MPSLRSALRLFLDDWRSDIAPAWREFLEGVEPAYDVVREDLSLGDNEIIFPGRKGREPQGAPPGSHAFRALDGIGPADVRCIVLGQDPYPDVDRTTDLARPFQATGRAFEQGNLSAWHDGYVASSLRSIVRCAAHARTSRVRYMQEPAGWAAVLADHRSGDLALEPPQELFDHWQRQGVLFLNTGLTLTRYKRGGHDHQKYGHIPLWSPVVEALCSRLAQGATPVVFLAWGSYARRFLVEIGILESQEHPVVAPHFPKTAVSVRSHPSYLPNFLEELPFNALLHANEELERNSAPPVDW